MRGWERGLLAQPAQMRMTEREVLFAISELIGPPSSWPSWTRTAFFSKHLNNVNGMRIITFGLGNGLPPHLLHQWMHVRGVKVDKVKFSIDITRVLKGMTLDLTDKGALKYFYWDLTMQEYCWMNGRPRNALTKGYKAAKERATY